MPKRIYVGKLADRGTVEAVAKATGISSRALEQLNRGEGELTQADLRKVGSALQSLNVNEARPRTE